MAGQRGWKRARRLRSSLDQRGKTHPVGSARRPANGLQPTKNPPSEPGGRISFSMNFASVSYQHQPGMSRSSDSGRPLFPQKWPVSVCLRIKSSGGSRGGITGQARTRPRSLDVPRRLKCRCVSKAPVAAARSASASTATHRTRISAAIARSAARARAAADMECTDRRP